MIVICLSSSVISCNITARKVNIMRQKLLPETKEENSNVYRVRMLNYHDTPRQTGSGTGIHRSSFIGHTLAQGPIFIVSITLSTKSFCKQCCPPTIIIPVNRHQRNKGWVSPNGKRRKVDHDEQDHYKYYIGLLFMSNERIACFPAGKRGLTKTGPLRFVALSKIIFSLI